MKTASLITLSCCLALGLGLGASPVEAQQGKSGATTKGGKIYRWVDKDGKVHYGDTLPAEALGRERTEYGKSGRKQGEIASIQVREVDPDPDAASTQGATPAPTDHPASIVAGTGLEPAAAPVVAGEGVLADVLGPASPQELAAHRAAVAEQAQQAKQAMAADHKALVAKLQQAGNLELAGKPVPAALAKQVQEMATVVNRQRQELARLQASLAVPAQAIIPVPSAAASQGNESKDGAPALPAPSVER